MYKHTDLGPWQSGITAYFAHVDSLSPQEINEKTDRL
jgi:hypothetical protein